MFFLFFLGGGIFFFLFSMVKKATTLTNLGQRRQVTDITTVTYTVIMFLVPIDCIFFKLVHFYSATREKSSVLKFNANLV